MKYYKIILAICITLQLSIESYAQKNNKNINPDSTFYIKIGTTYLSFVYVKGDTFEMGCTNEQQKHCFPNEKPKHKVYVNDFFISTTEITTSQWHKILYNTMPFVDNEPIIDLGFNDQVILKIATKDTIKIAKTIRTIYFPFVYNYQIENIVNNSDTIPYYLIYQNRTSLNLFDEHKKLFEDFLQGLCPIDSISWYDVSLFLEKINKESNLKFRLPTEAEWEYAARGGHKSKKQYLYSGSDNIYEVCQYGDDAKYPVARLKPNELGIYDMTGNVAEWCIDNYGEYPQTKQTIINPINKSKTLFRVVKGGGYGDNSNILRVSSRIFRNGSNKANIGFRLVVPVTRHIQNN